MKEEMSEKWKYNVVLMRNVSFFTGNDNLKRVISVRPEAVDLVLRQGRTKFSAAGVAALRRGQKTAENAVSGQDMPLLGGH